MVWTVMLVHDDWSQACLSQHTRLPIVLVSSLMLSYDVLSMSLGDTHPGCKADTYCIDKVFISSQLCGRDAYIILRWHSAESCHPGWQLCCFYKTRLPFHLMPVPWYTSARGWLACWWKACSGIIVVVWWEEEGVSCSQVTVVLGGCLLN